MRTLFFVSAVLACFVCTAQDQSVKRLKDEASRSIKKDMSDTVERVWRRGGIYNINLAQGSLNNWAAGGDNFSLTLTSYLGVYAFYKKDRHSWDNTLDFNFGYVKSTSLGARKNDDRLDILSKYGYSITDKLHLAGLVNFRSQMLNGYTYDDNKRTFTSAFLSPAYVLISPGIDWKPNRDFSLFVSPVTTRFIVVRNDSLSAKGLYGVDSGSHSVTEFGAFLTANYLKEISKNVTYKGRLDLFSNYRHNPKNVDLFMTNVFSFKISRVLAASWNVDFIYDDDVRIFGKNKDVAALQLKSIIGLGLQLKF